MLVDVVAGRVVLVELDDEVGPVVLVLEEDEDERTVVEVVLEGGELLVDELVDEELVDELVVDDELVVELEDELVEEDVGDETVTVSAGSPHAVVTAALAGSPE